MTSTTKQYAVRLRYPSTRQYLADSDDIPWPYDDLVIAQQRAEYYGGDVVDYPPDAAEAKLLKDQPALECGDPDACAGDVRLGTFGARCERHRRERA